jgi:sarcosine oxidase subunit delta
MALLLTCPNCGARPYTEFWFGGEVPASTEEVGGVEASRSPASATSEVEASASASTSAAALAAEEADFERVWLRANVCGPQRERWFHHAGCRRWHTALRDTPTNELHAAP